MSLRLRDVLAVLTGSDAALQKAFDLLKPWLRAHKRKVFSMPRADIEVEHTIINGIIRSPGKFEGSPVYVPYFWTLGLDGGDDDREGGLEGEPYVSIFHITDEERMLWPELTGVTQLRLWEDEVGFVHHRIIPLLRVVR